MLIPKFGDGLSPEPDDIDRIMEALLPERCRGCKHAEFMIGLLLTFESSTGGPWPIIEDIEERCTGYEGELEPSTVRSIDTLAGRGLLFDFFDEDKCPYASLPEN